MKFLCPWNGIAMCRKNDIDESDRWGWEGHLWQKLTLVHLDMYVVEHFGSGLILRQIFDVNL